ncbi:LOW QUALITY PROTEIN: hypothetical protein V2J09_015927, partial [Rumex salicifolius]
GGHFFTISASKGDTCASFIIAYAPPTVHRRSFGEEIDVKLRAITGAVFFGGDLNCILQSEECHEGSGELHLDFGDIQNLIDNNGLIDIGFVGQNLTWSRGNIANHYIPKRHDKVLMNMEACLSWPTTRVEKDNLTAQLDQIQIDIGNGPSVRLLEQEALIQDKLELILKQEEILWMQKFRKLWLKEGDRNTDFFPSLYDCPKKVESEGLRDGNDQWVSNKQELESLVVEFFKDLYSIPQEEMFPVSTLHTSSLA